MGDSNPLANIIQQQQLLQQLRFAQDPQLQAQVAQNQTAPIPTPLDVPQYQPPGSQVTPPDTNQGSAYQPYMNQYQQNLATYDPKIQAQIQALENIQSPTAPDISGYKQARDIYGAVGAPPDPSQYPRSALRTALVAPFEFGRYLRDPMRTAQNMDLLTRKGFLPAQMEYNRKLAAAQQQYGIQKDIANEDFSLYSAQLNAQKDDVARRQNLINLYGAFENRPLEVADALRKWRAGDLNEKMLNAQLADLSFKSDEHTYKGRVGGEDVQLTKGHRPGEPWGWFERGPDGKPKEVQLDPGTVPVEITTQPATPFQSMLQARTAQWQEKNKGQPLTPDVQVGLEKLANEDLRDPSIAAAAERQTKSIEARTKAVIQAQEHSDLVRAQNDAVKPLEANAAALGSQIETIKQTLNSLALGGTNAVAGNLAGLENTRSILKGSGARMTNMEVNLSQGGKWSTLGAYIRKWNFDPKTAGGVTPEILRQMKEFQQSMLDEATRVSNLQNEYVQRIRAAKRQEDILPLEQNYTNWLVNPEGMRANQPVQVQRGPDGKLLPPQ